MKVFFYCSMVVTFVAILFSYGSIDCVDGHKLNSRNKFNNEKDIQKLSAQFSKAFSSSKNNSNSPNPSLNKPLNRTELEDLDSGVFIVQFFNFILTGRYDGVSEIGDAFDENTLHAILALGIQLYITVVAEDPPEDAYGFFKLLSNLYYF